MAIYTDTLGNKYIGRWGGNLSTGGEVFEQFKVDLISILTNDTVNYSLVTGGDLGYNQNDGILYLKYADDAGVSTLSSSNYRFRLTLGGNGYYGGTEFGLRYNPTSSASGDNLIYYLGNNQTFTTIDNSVRYYGFVSPDSISVCAYKVNTSGAVVSLAVPISIFKLKERAGYVTLENSYGISFSNTATRISTTGFIKNYLPSFSTLFPTDISCSGGGNTNQKRFTTDFIFRDDAPANGYPYAGKQPGLLTGTLGFLGATAYNVPGAPLSGDSTIAYLPFPHVAEGGSTTPLLTTWNPGGYALLQPVKLA